MIGDEQEHAWARTDDAHNILLSSLSIDYSMVFAALGYCEATDLLMVFIGLDGALLHVVTSFKCEDL